MKLAGEDTNSPHMVRAREQILSRGGAAKSNVFTRIALAMFEQIPWRGVPFIPVEIMFLPRWFPFHLSKVSYWSRTVMVPLFVLCSLKAKAINPTKAGITELFITPPDQERNYFQVRSSLNKVVLFFERIGYRLEGLIPNWIRRKALGRAEKWIVERLNGESGLGAIFPAMVNAYEALAQLGYPSDHKYRRDAKKALQKLLVITENDAFCQPCVSPVWDTLLATCALQEASGATNAISKALGWLKEEQLLEAYGDWKSNHPKLMGGGWPFQFNNDHFPDLDDTAFAAFSLARTGDPKFQNSMIRAADWLVGLQSKNGGFGSFDADNTYYYLNEIPFADHGALLDPPSSDVTGRCLMFLGVIADQHPTYKHACKEAIRYLSNEQEADGSWFGRWGTNYIYGTWSVLVAFESCGMDKQDPMIQKAVIWLKEKQRYDGGWGEDNYSYYDRVFAGNADRSTSFQTAWALLALMSAGEIHSGSVKRGIEYLLRNQEKNGSWNDPEFTAPGFPKVFYLKYHGYNKYFPLWALARYRNECTGDRVLQNRNP